MVVVIFGEDQEEDIKTCLEYLESNFPQLNSIFYVVNKKMNDSINDLDLIHYAGKETITESLNHIQYQIGPKSFFSSPPLIQV